MLSLSEIMGVIVTFIVLSTASGHGDWVWKGIAEIRRATISSTKQEWPCPSIFDRNACKRWVDRH